MDNCTHEVRSEYWRNIILQCEQRPNGQTARQWMKDNGITEQSYYFWQRKFRKEAYQQLSGAKELPSIQKSSELSFVDIKLASSSNRNAPNELNDIPITAMISVGTARIAITNDISKDILATILQEVSHA